ncbi:hypothetical protein QYF36_023473 [Acer negundo]|nr:hypothetical protein QYF36_023473 [Acer negundo]
MHAGAREVFSLVRSHHGFRISIEDSEEIWKPDMHRIKSLVCSMDHFASFAFSSSVTLPDDRRNPPSISSICRCQPFSLVLGYFARY